jgi:hypothetical protein
MAEQTKLTQFWPNKMTQVHLNIHGLSCALYCNGGFSLCLIAEVSDNVFG